MKRIKKVLIIAMCMMLVMSSTACGKNKLAYEKSKPIFTSLKSAFEDVDAIANDFIVAYDYGEETGMDATTEDIIASLPFSEAELNDTAKLILKETGDFSDDDIDSLGDDGALTYYWLLSYMAEEAPSTTYVRLVGKTYEYNGTFDNVEIYIDEIDKELYAFNKEFEDYENYDSLLKLFSNIEEYYGLVQVKNDEYSIVKANMQRLSEECKSIIGQLDSIYINE